MDPRSLPVIATPAEIRKADEHTISTLGLPGLTLMENAGAGIAQHILEGVFKGASQGKSVAIICGPGNNGGDGFVIARHLNAAGVRCSIWLCGVESALKGDAAVNAARLGEIGLSIYELGSGAPAPDFH